MGNTTTTTATTTRDDDNDDNRLMTAVYIFTSDESTPKKTFTAKNTANALNIDVIVSYLQSQKIFTSSSHINIHTNNSVLTNHFIQNVHKLPDGVEYIICISSVTQYHIPTIRKKKK